MKINNKNVDIYNINQKKLILPKYSIYLNEHPKVKKQHEVKQQAVDPSRGNTVCG